MARTWAPPSGTAATTDDARATSARYNPSVAETNALNTADATPPTVAMTAPAAGATVAGTAVTVSATASDNIAVVGVQFLLDGANLGAEDTASPYSIVWNTAGVVNGVHALTAIARDGAGNTTTAAAVNVTVSNDV